MDFTRWSRLGGPMTSVRSGPPPLPSREPSSAPTLAQLRERARDMEAGKPEWDALLREFARPLGPDDDLRARADVLRLILEDPWLGGFTGSQGRRLDVAAAQALVNLGEPYASELPDEARALLARPKDPSAKARPGPPGTDDAEPPVRSGVGLAFFVCIVEMLLVLANSMQGWTWAAGGLVLSSSLLPSLLPRDSAHPVVRGVRNTGLVLMGLMALAWFALGVVGVGISPLVGLIPLGMGSMRALSAWRLKQPLPPPSPTDT